MAFDPSNPNLAIWLAAEPTDPAHTKGFKRGGGFSGTSLNATYVMKRLTDMFGPVGEGWGYRIVSMREVTGAPIFATVGGEPSPGDVIGHEMVQVCEIEFWWRRPDGKGGYAPSVASFSQVGQTMMVEWSRKYKSFSTDEEAWKKSLTDAITKAASHLGVGADIHLGLFDDNKYLARRREEAEAEQAALDHGPALKEADEVIELLATVNAEAFAELEQRARTLVDPVKAADPAKLKAMVDAIKAAMKRLGVQPPAKAKASAPADEAA